MDKMASRFVLLVTRTMLTPNPNLSAADVKGECAVDLEQLRGTWAVSQLRVDTNNAETQENADERRETQASEQCGIRI